MSDRLIVLMDRIRAGAIERTSNDVVFTYDEAYRSRAGATPLSTSMPLPIRNHRGANVTTWLWGLLPENHLVLDRWAREFRATASDPVSLLSTPVGRDCAGAVQFVPEHELDDVLVRGGDVQWLSDDDLEEIVTELARDETAWLGTHEHHGQFSIAGAQPKIGLRFDGARWGLPRGAAATTHILKPGVTDVGGGMHLSNQALNEHLCQTSMRIVGLRAARSRLMRIADQHVIVVERYDRATIDGQIVRVHQEDLCQALGVMPSAKYEIDGGPGVARIVDLLHETITPRTEAVAACLRFAEALAVNWLIGGTDEHAKNYSLLLSGSQVRLAPLYDVASALPYWHPKRLRLAMKLGGDNRVWPWINRWPAVAEQLRLDADALQARVLELAEQVPAALERSIASLEDQHLRELETVSKLQLEVAVQCQRAAQLLG